MTVAGQLYFYHKIRDAVLLCGVTHYTVGRELDCRPTPVSEHEKIRLRLAVPQRQIFYYCDILGFLGGVAYVSFP
jgi:hypothetical protein